MWSRKKLPGVKIIGALRGDDPTFNGLLGIGGVGTTAENSDHLKRMFIEDICGMRRDANADYGTRTAFELTNPRLKIDRRFQKATGRQAVSAMLAIREQRQPSIDYQDLRLSSEYDDFSLSLRYPYSWQTGTAASLLVKQQFSETDTSPVASSLAIVKFDLLRIVVRGKEKHYVNTSRGNNYSSHDDEAPLKAELGILVALISNALSLQNN